jgi:hypothetical protein
MDPIFEAYQDTISPDEKKEMAKYGIKEIRHGIKPGSVAIIKSKWPWLLKAKMKDMVIDSYDRVPSLSHGTWINGTFETGWMYKVDWKNGTFKSGTFSEGIWKNGTFVTGHMKSSVWENGKVADGNRRIVFDFCTFKGGTFHGTFEDGTFENGTFEYGKFDATWKNGTFKNGTFYGTKWKDGTWINGDAPDGIDRKYPNQKAKDSNVKYNAKNHVFSREELEDIYREVFTKAYKTRSTVKPRFAQTVINGEGKYTFRTFDSNPSLYVDVTGNKAKVSSTGKLSVSKENYSTSFTFTNVKDFMKKLESFVNGVFKDFNPKFEKYAKDYRDYVKRTGDMT